MTNDKESVQMVDLTSTHQPLQSQSFVMPRDCYKQIRSHYCLYRFYGMGQIAGHGFKSPAMIPAHIVVFDSDHFAVIFLELSDFALYSRIKEDLTAHMK